MGGLSDKMAALFGDDIELPPVPAGMSEAEWFSRIELAACYWLVDHYGWTSIVYNHVTLRIPGSEDFLDQLFGLRYDEIKASDLIRIDSDGNKKIRQQVAGEQGRLRYPIPDYSRRARRPSLRDPHP